VTGGQVEQEEKEEGEGEDGSRRGGCAGFFSWTCRGRGESFREDEAEGVRTEDEDPSGELVPMQEWVKATGASEPLPAPDVKMSKPPSHHGYIEPDSSKPKSRRRSRRRSIPG